MKKYFIYVCAVLVCGMLNLTAANSKDEFVYTKQYVQERVTYIYKELKNDADDGLNSSFHPRIVSGFTRQIEEYVKDQKLHKEVKYSPEWYKNMAVVLKNIHFVKAEMFKQWTKLGNKKKFEALMPKYKEGIAAFKKVASKPIKVDPSKEKK